MDCDQPCTARKQALAGRQETSLRKASPILQSLRDNSHVGLPKVSGHHVLFVTSLSRCAVWCDQRTDSWLFVFQIARGRRH